MSEGAGRVEHTGLCCVGTGVIFSGDCGMGGCGLMVIGRRAVVGVAAIIHRNGSSTLSRFLLVSMRWDFTEYSLPMDIGGDTVNNTLVFKYCIW